MAAGRTRNGVEGTGARGVVHVHSTRSFDGKCSYAELKSFFRSKGLGFACMTEHIEGLGQADIDAIVAGCAAESDDSFALVPGIEMDCFKVYFLGVGAGPVDFTSDESIFRSLRARAQLCVFAHPIKAGYRYPDWLVDECDGVEIWNTKHDGKHGPRPQSEALLGEVRVKRPAAIAVAGLDFHGPRDFVDVALEVRAEGTLTPALVLSRLRSGAFAILRNGRPLDALGPVGRAVLRARIRMMDASHALHRALRSRGLGIPRPLKRVARRFFEG